jgi:hypothetical protein
MAPDDRHDSAPDLRILGDRITLQPGGFVEPPAKAVGEEGEGKEEALMKNNARFRSEPFRYSRLVLCPHNYDLPRCCIFHSAN